MILPDRVKKTQSVKFFVSLSAWPPDVPQVRQESIADAHVVSWKQISSEY